MRHRLTVTRDIDSDKLWMSREINHGDWPFRFVLRLQYVGEWGEEAVRDMGKYHMTLLAVSPVAARETDSYAKALNSCGYTDEQVKEWGEYAPYEVLIDYGTYARLWQSSGNNLSSLLREASKQLTQSDFLFGFAMDRTQNAIGTTGWDAIRGDVLGGLREREEVSE